MVLPCFSCVTGVRRRLAGNACDPYRPIGSARPVHSQIDAVKTRFRWKPSPVITVVEGFTIARSFKIRTRCAPGTIRTCDQLLRRQLLYPLSYGGGTCGIFVKTG